MLRLVATTTLMLGAAGLAACEKKAGQARGGELAADPEFDAKWKELASKGVEALYIEDDKGEGLMGNVRRASDLRPDPSANEVIAAADAPLPDHPAGESVQSVIRRNLAAVKSCYMALGKAGAAPSGKAIVSFEIGPDGSTNSVKIDAPVFDGTPLTGCVTGQVARWTFPKSQKGGGLVSYPFVFVGG